MFLEIPPLKPKLLEGLLRGTHDLFPEIDIPTVSQPIEALARVVWVEGNIQDGYGVGISFLSINEEDRDKLISYIIKGSLQE